MQVVSLVNAGAASARPWAGYRFKRPALHEALEVIIPFLKLMTTAVSALTLNVSLFACVAACTVVIGRCLLRVVKPFNTSQVLPGR